MASLGPQLRANDVQMRFGRNRGQNKIFDFLTIFGPNVVQNGPEMAHFVAFFTQSDTFLPAMISEAR
jgi:hypothetical protein